MADQTGVASAVAALMEDAEPPLLQPALFPAGEIAALPKFQHQRGQQLAQRGPGRPAGSRNRRTEQFRDYVLRKGEHPADGLIELYSRPVHDLAAELGCTRIEAMNLQVTARKVLLEYVEGKMPVTVNANVNGGISVIFEDALGPASRVVDGEFFQALSDGDGGELDGRKLDDEA